MARLVSGNRRKRPGGPRELTSTRKAEAYRQTYRKAIAGSPQCLGSYAFLWGNKQEATATWFGLLLPDGSKTAAVDVLTELWSGGSPANRCPEVTPIVLEGPEQVDPGATIHASLTASDPEKDQLSYSWVLQREAVYGAGGDAEAAPPTFADAITKTDGGRVTVRMPKDGGGYRLFAVVRDGHGGAATANVPLYVKGPVSKPLARAATLPLTIYDEADTPATYVPTGWMGNVKAIQLDPKCADDPHEGKTCLRVTYQDTKDWGGVVWQSPPNDWGDLPGGYDLSGAKRLTFWARGAHGGEIVSFEFGLIAADKPFHDSAKGKLDRVTLTDEWTRYTIDLLGKDLSRIKTGFCWVVAADGKPITFDLDDIRFE